MSKKIYKQRFRKAWIANPNYKDWLKMVEGDDTIGFCDYCKCSIKARVSMIEKHGITRKHKNNAEAAISCQRRVKQPFVNAEINWDCHKTDKDLKNISMKNHCNHLTSYMQPSVSSSHLNQYAAVEQKLCSFIAEHNLPNSLLDHLSRLISNTCPDSKIAKDIKCSRTNKISETSESVIEKFEIPEHLSAEEIYVDSYDEVNDKSASVIHTDYRSPISLEPAMLSSSKRGTTYTTSHHTESNHEVNKKSEEDAIDIFAKFIAAQLRRLPEEHAINLTLEIHGLIAKKLVKALSDKDRQRNTGDSPQIITVSIDKELFPK